MKFIQRKNGDWINIESIDEVRILEFDDVIPFEVRAVCAQGFIPLANFKSRAAAQQYADNFINRLGAIKMKI